MIESISALLASLKASTPQILIGVAFFCGVLLLSPPSLAAQIGLQDFVETNRGYLGGGLIAAVCVLTSQFAWWAKGLVLSPFMAIWRMRRQALQMAELMPDEKSYLLRYINEQQNTQCFRIDDGIAQGLVAKKIIYRAASIGDLYDGFAYNLHPRARCYLSKHPEALNGAGKPPKPLPGGNSAW